MIPRFFLLHRELRKVTLCRKAAWERTIPAGDDKCGEKSSRAFLCLNCIALDEVL